MDLLGHPTNPRASASPSWLKLGHHCIWVSTTEKANGEYGQGPPDVISPGLGLTHTICTHISSANSYMATLSTREARSVLCEMTMCLVTGPQLRFLAYLVLFMRSYFVFSTYYCYFVLMFSAFILTIGLMKSPLSPSHFFLKLI